MTTEWVKSLQLDYAATTKMMVVEVLRPGKSQVKIVGIIPNKRSQLAHYFLVWGVHPVYGPATIGQVTIKVFYRLWLSPPRRFFFNV